VESREPAYVSTARCASRASVHNRQAASWSVFIATCGFLTYRFPVMGSN